MGRAPRPQGEATTYHAMARGNDRKSIFLDDTDREMLLAVVARVSARYDWRCHAYCLMPNHIHLAVTTAGADLAHAMRDLLGGYARAFNRRHGRVGHLFSARYRAVVVADDRQLLAVIRYVSLNPVEANLVANPALWPWGSYPALIGRAPCPAFLSPQLIWSMFSADHPRAQTYLRDFVEGMSPDVAVAFPHPLRRLRDEPGRPTISELLAVHGAHRGVETCLGYGYRQREIAEVLGISESALSHRRRRRL